MSPDAQYRFTIAKQELPTDVFGIWQITPEAQDFAVQEEAEEAHWEVELPEDPIQAAVAIEVQSQRLRVLDVALPYASARLDRYISNKSVSGISEGPIDSYTVSEPPPEHELSEWLELSVLQGEGTEAFDRQSDVRIKLQTECEELIAFMDQLRFSLSHFAHVKTICGENVLGQSCVAWSGDISTALMRSCSPTQAALHRQALALALDSRQAWMRLAMRVAGGGVKLAALATGIGALGVAPLALPAAYRFFIQIIRDIETIKEIRNPSG